MTINLMMAIQSSKVFAGQIIVASAGRLRCTLVLQ
jgi:hypothetical protein